MIYFVVVTNARRLATASAYDQLMDSVVNVLRGYKEILSDSRIDAASKVDLLNELNDAQLQAFEDARHMASRARSQDSRGGSEGGSRN
jgi:hypothetical protein